jgi:hypothetical protein
MKTFEEFWPFYLSEHSQPSNKAIHFFGFVLGLITIIYGFVTMDPVCFVVAPVLTYAFAWLGHALVQKNKPTTFKHPLWSFVSYFKMMGQILATRRLP